MSLIAQGYSKAITLLREASTSHGFVASIQTHDNYRRIWTRDGVVNGLAALLSDDDYLIETFRRTVQTIFNHQHPSGFIPSNVTVEGKTSYGGAAGRADNPSWAVIGLCSYILHTNDEAMREQYEEAVEACFVVMNAWEYNGKGLVYVPQSGDWADEYIYHGYVLFDQLLRVWALRLASAVYDRADWKEKEEQLIATIRHHYWNDISRTDCYSPNLARYQKEVISKYWTMGFNPGRVYPHFDLQANALALLLRIGDANQNAAVIQYMTGLEQEYNLILPSFFPTINDHDPDMSDLKGNYAYTFRNLPHEFHNGGLWPVWNGFVVAGLLVHGQRIMAKKITEGIHAANERSGWDFNECLHGKNESPIGVPQCTWSAGGAVIATATVLHDKIIPGI